MAASLSREKQRESKQEEEEESNSPTNIHSKVHPPESGTKIGCWLAFLSMRLFFWALSVTLLLNDLKNSCVLT
jgi:hypothetical protein